MVDTAIAVKSMDISQDKAFSLLKSRLTDPAKGPEKLTGTWGSYARLAAANLFSHLKRPILLLTPHIDDADKAVDDLTTFGASEILHLPAWEDDFALPDATDEIRAERLRIVSRLGHLARAKAPAIITASIQALCQPIPRPQDLRKNALTLQSGRDIEQANVIEWLVDNGFERVDQIDLPGQFAHRGGIIDIYTPLATDIVRGDDTRPADGETAVRIDFFGDTIESIRRINLDTLRSDHEIRSLSVLSGISETAAQELFLNILPDDTIAVLEEPSDCQDVANVFVARSEKPDTLFNWPDLHNALQRFRTVEFWRFAPDPADAIELKVRSLQQFQHTSPTAWAGHKETLAELTGRAKQGTSVYLYCESPAEISRVKEIIPEDQKTIPRNFHLLEGFINQGFYIESLETIIAGHHELFGQFSLRRRTRPVRAAVSVETLADLQPGDYVVHLSYGIGKYLGTQTLKEKDRTGEYLTIEYADKVKVQVSVANIQLIHKYIGTSPKRPNLSKVGSKRWQRQKDKVARSVTDLAAELLDVQAKRQALGGITYPPDTKWQTEFEESFKYQETADQQTAIEQIKRDMQNPTAMDRLLCGDVGYGKTEVAMRAAFKAVENGKQVAVLVPTTVLSVQHSRTFAERFADFPIAVEVLNRFRTTKEARDIIDRTAKGRVDILIGTHRLLSGDIRFKDLGLLIIDEEQRFGVAHKERLKRMRVNVDILTMTATPIPRTLHMALLGLRDISSLGTPPLDRRSVVTSVTAYHPELLRKAVLREMNRQGQIFFLHNRVKTIDKKAWDIQTLIPEAKIAVAHGQMPKTELEKAMIDFVTGRVDILVCTTIIESGLDIPNANTIFIDNADRFGLAELHQLRGRVGRYKHRAYAYMLMPAARTITPVAARRLKAIEEYSHLGAGFRIALRDLEIRGAGNILGPEQSGHIQLVGYQMYCEMLAQAVRKLKDQPQLRHPLAEIDLGQPSYIPKDYIASDRRRLEAYRKITVCANADELARLRDEFVDVYGELPPQVKSLLEIAELRILAGRRHIKSIAVVGQSLLITFTQSLTDDLLAVFENTKFKVDLAGPKTAYLRLTKNALETPTLIALMRKFLS